MLRKIPSLEKLVDTLRYVPCLASKNVYRVASYFLQMNTRQVEQVCTVIKAAQENVVPCATCFVWCEKDTDCMFCADAKRDQSVICVVETWQDLLVIEKTEGYSGVFHVLGGAVCPLEGIGPQDLTIEPLIQRVLQGAAQEIILATNQTPEGEATAAFIARKLQVTKAKVSCLARGVPVGSSLEFMDRVTIYKALSERRPF